MNHRMKHKIGSGVRGERVRQGVLYCSASPVLCVATVLSKFSMSLMLPPSHRRVMRGIQRLLYVTAAALDWAAAAAGWPVCL